MKNYFQFVAVFLGLVLLPACQITGSIMATNASTNYDFALSKISAGTAPADGSSQLLVTITFLDSKKTPKAGFVPTYTITTGSPVTVQPCSASDANGQSICALTAKITGVRHFKVTNVANPNVTLEADIKFTSVPVTSGLPEISVVPASGTVKLANGYTFSATIGDARDEGSSAGVPFPAPYTAPKGAGGNSGYTISSPALGSWNAQ